MRPLKFPIKNAIEEAADENIRSVWSDKETLMCMKQAEVPHVFPAHSLQSVYGKHDVKP